MMMLESMEQALDTLCIETDGLVMYDLDHDEDGMTIFSVTASQELYSRRTPAEYYQRYEDFLCYLDECTHEEDGVYYFDDCTVVVRDEFEDN